MGGFLIPGSPDHEDEFTFDGAASWDPYTAYDALLDLHRNGLMKVRMRVFFLSMDNALAIPILTRRVENAFREFGNDWLKIAGLGEFITNWPLFGAGRVPPRTIRPRCRRLRERGWIYQQHALTSAEDNVAITRLGADQRADADRAAALVDRARADDHAAEHPAPEGARRPALALHGFRYLAGTPTAERRRRTARSSTAASRSARGPTRRRSRRSTRG